MIVTTTHHKQLLEAVCRLAIEAGSIILEIYHQGFDITTKNDRSPVTTADLAAHKIIRDRLSDLTPEFPIMSEEDEYLPYPARSDWTTYWLVDPLDGTREFIKRNGEFTVNIALVHRHEPILGVVHAPVLKRNYYACRGFGAYRHSLNDDLQQIKIRRARADCPTILGSRSHAGKSLNRFVSKVGRCELIRMGSSLKTCLVAEGSADIYPRFSPTSEWDTAAAQCVLEEAGGCVTDFNMNILRYNVGESLQNPPFLAMGDISHDWSTYLS